MDIEQIYDAVQRLTRAHRSDERIHELLDQDAGREKVTMVLKEVHKMRGELKDFYIRELEKLRDLYREDLR
jgi:hypothetical protein